MIIMILERSAMNVENPIQTVIVGRHCVSVAINLIIDIIWYLIWRSMIIFIDYQNLCKTEI